MKTSTGIVAASPELLARLHQIREAMRSWIEVAAYLDVSPTLLSHVLNRKRSPSARMLDKLGFERRVEYVERTMTT